MQGIITSLKLQRLNNSAQLSTSYIGDIYTSTLDFSNGILPDTAAVGSSLQHWRHSHGSGKM